MSNHDLGSARHVARAVGLSPAIAGRSVLDAHCVEPDLCRNALELGASRVLGLVRNRDTFRSMQDQLAHGATAVELRCQTEETGLLDEPFDTVFCLGLLDQVRHPFLLLDRLMVATRQRLIVDGSTLDSDEQKRVGLRWWKRMHFRQLGPTPLIWIGRHPYRHGRRRFVLSVEAIKRLLTQHRLLFSRVDVHPTGTNSRAVLVAERRRIDRLILLAGPTASGKSTLIHRLLHGQEPSLSADLQIDDVGEWREMHLSEILCSQNADLGKIIVHYDFLSRLSTDTDLDQLVELHDLVSCAGNTTVVTLWTEPERLREQFEQNEVLPFGGTPRSRKNQRLRKEYGSRTAILEYYRDWIDFASALAPDQRIVTTHPATRVFSVEQWKSEQLATATPC